MAELLQIVDSLEVNELHRAVQENRLEAVKFLIKSGADITYPINKDQTPLYIAVKNNYRDITEVLCKSKSRMEVRSMIDRQTLDTDTGALHLAAKNNSIENTRFLLSCGANFEIRDKESRRIQDLTTDDSIKELVKNIEDVFELTKQVDNQDLLEKLNSLPVENVASVMYARDEQPTTRIASLPTNHTALQMAMKSNDMRRVEIIATFRIDKLKQNDWQAGANIDKLVQHSKAARRHFSYLNGFRWHPDRKYKKREIVDLLHNSFAFLEAYKEQGNLILENQPLLIVIEEALEFFQYWEGSNIMEERVEKLLSADAAYVVQLLKLCVTTPMLFYMKSVYTAELLEAAKQNDLTKVEKYLTGHPDLNKTDESSGCTALHHAIYYKNEKMTKLLLKFGADPTIANKSEEPPLHIALRGSEGSAFSKFRELSADILLLLFENTRDDKLASYVNERTESNGSTPLHTAARTSNYRLAEFLLRKGCVYCSRDKTDYTPSYHSRDDEVRNLLKCTEQSFEQARDGKIEELMQAMKRFDENTLLAVCGARNEKNLTLDQVLDGERFFNEAGVVRKMLDDPKGAQEMIACKCRCTRAY